MVNSKNIRNKKFLPSLLNICIAKYIASLNINK